MSHTYTSVPFLSGLKEHVPFSVPAHVLTRREEAVTFPVHATSLEGADADVLLLGENLGIHTVIAKGKVFLDKGELLVKGTYE